MAVRRVLITLLMRVDHELLRVLSFPRYCYPGMTHIHNSFVGVCHDGVCDGESATAGVKQLYRIQPSLILLFIHACVLERFQDVY